jgi:hypothetical protein
MDDFTKSPNLGDANVLIKLEFLIKYNKLNYFMS